MPDYIQFIADNSYITVIFLSIVLGAIPIVFSYRIYQKTKINEYLIFNLFWIFSIFTGFTAPLIERTNSLLLVKIHESSLVWSFFIIFLHAIRLVYNSEKPTHTPSFLRYFIYVIVVYTLVLQVIILSWSSMVQEEAKVLFWEMSPHPIHKADEAGLAIGSVVIYSRGYATVIHNLAKLE
ncbi:MAG: hypothetical protein ACXAB7_14845 [Candidatus Kariarchaeaceae archaeon]